MWLQPRGGVNAGLLAEAAALMHHRGPDAARMALWDTLSPGALPVVAETLSSPRGRSYSLGLAHTRLSILDLTRGSHQPMFSEDGRYALIFNGEIYNYLEKRAEMEAMGERFRTSGDTEVLLRILIRQGADALADLNGMWAFCFLDLERRECLLARDRYGKKPLFYHNTGDAFLAASEPKAVFRLLGDPVRRLNPDFLRGFLALKWYPADDHAATAYRDLRAVPPGAVLRLSLDNMALSRAASFALKTFRDKPTDAKRVAEDIASAVTLRLRSDVPVGILVSGGVDSTAIAAQAAKAGGADLRFYTALLRDRSGKPKRDLGYARLLAHALSIELREIDLPLDQAEAMADFRLLTRQIEAPINPGLITVPGYRIYRAMAAEGVKVALDGTGGDEVMGGYPQYLQHLSANAVNRGRLASALCAAHAASRFYDRTPVSVALRMARAAKNTLLPGRIALPHEARLSTAAGYFRSPWADGMSEAVTVWRQGQAESLADLQFYALTQGIMPYYLFVADQISMANSLELRCPFLDYRLARYLNLPDHLKFNAGYNKYLLRKTLPPEVPDAVRWRKDKEGFENSWTDFYSLRGGLVEETVMGCRTGREMLDLDRLHHDLGSERRPDRLGYLRDLYAGIFHIGLLEAEYPCTL